MVVPLDVSDTYSASASMTGFPGKSVRQNLYPWFAGAGLKVILTFTPVCNPFPLRLMDFARVRCFSLITTKIIFIPATKEAKNPELSAKFTVMHKGSGKCLLQNCYKVIMTCPF